MPEANIQQAVIQTGNWVNSKLKEIFRIETEGFRKILYFSLIDSFAQSWKDYPRNGASKVFAEFLVSFSSQYREVLQQVCPVTLYHHYSDKYNFGQLRLPEGRLLLADSTVLERESERLLLLIPDQQQREFARTKHQYCQLMYAERNKLVHELTQIGMPIDFGESLPHVAQGSRQVDGASSDISWQMVIPEKFIVLVLQDAINGYLTHCEQEGIVPFSNNEYSRKSRSAWYD